MSDEEAPQIVEEPIGWRVLDPDGNVIASGPCVELDAVSDTGEEQ